MGMEVVSVAREPPEPAGDVEASLGARTGGRGFRGLGFRGLGFGGLGFRGRGLLCWGLFV